MRRVSTCSPCFYVPAGIQSASTLTCACVFLHLSKSSAPEQPHSCHCSWESSPPDSRSGARKSWAKIAPRARLPPSLEGCCRRPSVSLTPLVACHGLQTPTKNPASQPARSTHTRHLPLSSRNGQEPVLRSAGHSETRRLRSLRIPLHRRH